MTKKYMLLYGKKSVLERLTANPQSIKKIITADNFNDSKISKLIEMHNIINESLSAKKVQDLKQAKNVQGIVAKVEHFVYADFEQLLEQVNELTLFFLDRINDPQNLGVIIRTLACFSGFAIVLPEKEATQVTEAVMHVASGGENYVKIAKVNDLQQAIIKAQKKGVNIAGAVIDVQAVDIRKADWVFPLGIVLGAETTGISTQIQKQLDQKISIPMPGKKLSFNLAMAATVFSYEITRQKKFSS
ncbi:MAG: RNA methyltransferase [Candidatus Omnitrophica bacterium]|nr:RNA methyltransferase [Candidatus Omnitrophota bacterium]